MEPIYVCDFCFGPLEVAYDYEALRKVVTRESIERGPASIWRYADLLPCDREYAVDIQAGFTPLIKADRLGKELGLNHLYLKNDCANPTWSFKDRVVTVAATKAREFGFTTLACASTGNLANSVSAHAARAGMDVVPYALTDADGRVAGLNRVGLRRAGFPRDHVADIRNAFRILFSVGSPLENRMEQLAGAVQSPPGQRLLQFVKATSKRGLAGRSRRGTG